MWNVEKPFAPAKNLPSLREGGKRSLESLNCKWAIYMEVLENSPNCNKHGASKVGNAVIW